MFIFHWYPIYVYVVKEGFYITVLLQIIDCVYRHGEASLYIIRLCFQQTQVTLIFCLQFQMHGRGFGTTYNTGGLTLAQRLALKE